MISECQAIPTIATKDLAESRRFYEEVLGLPIERDDEQMGVWYRCGRGSLYLYETPNAGFARHTVCNFESEHIDEDIQELRDHGVRFETYDDMPGVEWDGDVAVMEELRGVWFKDPAGNILGMFERAPVLARA